MYTSPARIKVTPSSLMFNAEELEGLGCDITRVMFGTELAKGRTNTIKHEHVCEPKTTTSTCYVFSPV